MSSPVPNTSPVAFNPYHIWLGIPPDECPPNYYRLLGISLFESNPDVIANAADQRMAHLRSFQNGPRAKFCQQLLNRVADAQSCLLDNTQRQPYDAELRKNMRRVEPPLRPIASAPGTIPIGIMPDEIEPEPIVLERDFADSSGEKWFMSTPEGRQYGPVDKERLDTWEKEGRLVAGCFVRPASKLKWASASEYYPWLENRRTEVFAPFDSSIVGNSLNTHRQFERGFERAAYDGTNTDRVLAGILGIFVGCLGIHKFVLGYTTAGFIMLLVSVVLSFTIVAPFAMAIVGLVEGILYLSMDDETFYETYVVEKKEWL